MSNIKLKSILGKRKKDRAVLELLLAEVGSPVSITDPDLKVLLGADPIPDQDSEDILFANQILGKIFGPKSHLILLKNTIELLLNKEDERKEMGNEVLQLYREINLIYGFSEELAKTIDPDKIASIALEQAQKLIKADAGRVLLIDSSAKELIPLASFGATVSDDLIKQMQSHIIQEFISDVKADIIQNTGLDKRTKNLQIQLKSILYAPLKIGERVLGLIILGQVEQYDYKANDLKLLNTLALQAASAIESGLLYQKNINEARQREAELQRIHDATKKFVPYDFIELLGRKSILDVMLGDQVQKEVTVMFSDIRSYTTLSEDMSPEQNFRFLNSYLGRVGPIINSHGGFIISFLGDGILALFLNSTSDAIRAGVGIQKVIHEYNIQRVQKARKPIKLGIGMHYGPLIMGIMGNEKRQEANLVSDTVNTASRMEGLTKYYGSPLIVTESVLNKTKEPVDCHYRSLGKVQVKGKQNALEIFDVFAGDAPFVMEKKLASQSVFEEGLAKYNIRAFEEATAAFAKVLSKHPEDRAAQLYLSNAIRYHTSGVGTDWEGVEIMDIK